ncbi:hypothetical protein BDQ17DRAFT_341669 [Cyathus striatus]|nr:hypothetical protein BDQ17DRAFT_341669 [Cyathus striatus]
MTAPLLPALALKSVATWISTTTPLLLVHINPHTRLLHRRRRKLHRKHSPLLHSQVNHSLTHPESYVSSIPLATQSQRNALIALQS